MEAPEGTGVTWRFFNHIRSLFQVRKQFSLYSVPRPSLPPAFDQSQWAKIKTVRVCEQKCKEWEAIN